MPLFSIIVPTYNRRDLLQKTLASIWNQTLADFELIVVDDGSTDGSLEWLKTQGERLILVSQANRGPGAARNLGAKEATGKYLAFLDSDDLWFPWTLATYAEVILKTGEPSFIAGKPARFGEVAELQTVKSAPAQTLEFPDYLSSGSEWRWWGVSSFVIKREAFEAVDGFTDEWINGEDADLAMRLGDSKGFVQIQAPATFGYREHAVSAMKDLGKTLSGAFHQINAEKAGRYSGGQDRAAERRFILCRHTRPVSFDCLSQKKNRDAWELYRATFRWHLALRKWKYLVGFPLKAILSH